METMLRNIDFAALSKVQNSLKYRLMMKYDSCAQVIDDYELDNVVAAAIPVKKSYVYPG